MNVWNDLAEFARTHALPGLPPDLASDVDRYLTEQPDPGDQIPDVENDPVPEPNPAPEGEPE